MNTEPNTFTYPYLNRNNINEVKTIPREFDDNLFLRIKGAR